MRTILKNLILLKKDMEKLDWTICSFIFSYKQVEYIVLVKRFVRNEQKINKFALVKMHFMRSDNLTNDLICEANSLRLLIDPKTMRKYFSIEYVENLGDILKQFTQHFGHYIPVKVPEYISESEKIAMVNSLSLSDSEDPMKIYCKNIKRNPNGKKRSEFNSDKAKLLRKKLFEYFKDDKTISFCFSRYIEDENSDAEILTKFSINNGS